MNFWSIITFSSGFSILCVRKIPGNFPHYEDYESCIVHDYTDVRFLEIVANRLERSRLTNCIVAYIYVNQ